jgi:hypothetical protein
MIMLEGIRALFSSVSGSAYHREIEILPPLRPLRERIRPQPGISGPNWRRTATVYAVLSTVPTHYTYGQLIRCVRFKTGIGCSRKLIARWKREQREKARLNSAASVAVGALLSVVILTGSACGHSQKASTTTAPTPVHVESAPALQRSGLPRLLKMTVTIASPDDLRVKARAEVGAGDVISDRRADRQRLTAQRTQLRIALRRLEGQGRAAAESMQLLEGLNTEFKPASLAAEEAAIARAEAQVSAIIRKVEIQRQRLSVLPSAVTEVEAVSEGIDASLIRAHEEIRLSILADEERQARAEVDLARARMLVAGESQRVDSRRRSIDAARDAAAARERVGQIEIAATQIQAQIAAIEERIAQLAAVRAPFAGRIERIHWEEGRDGQITVAVYLSVSAAGDER